MRRIVLVTGSRRWRNRALIRAELVKIKREHQRDLNMSKKRPIIIQGGAQGADHVAHEEAVALDLISITVPAEWKRFDLRAGPVRNQEMLDFMLNHFCGRMECLAFHEDIANSTGTRDMIRRCEKAGIPVRLITGSEQEMAGLVARPCCLC